jgi:hypothetical protein
MLLHLPHAEGRFGVTFKLLILLKMLLSVLVLDALCLQDGEVI